MSDISFDRLSSIAFEEFCFDLLSASGFVNVDWRKGTGLKSSPADRGRDVACDEPRTEPDGSRHFERWFVDCNGATLVFVGQFQNGETDTRFQPGFIPTRIPVGDAIVHQLSVYQVEWMRCQGSDDEWLQRRDEAFTSERIRALKSAVVALSRTDGALIFDSHLELVAAGAFLKVTSVATATGGARRKSAESFVRSNPGTAAVVISQDGEVILFK
jgi:hypothetical protein